MGIVYIHHERHKTRLKKYDYSQQGWYFVTICTKNKEMFFGEIVDGKMILNNVGIVVESQWKWLFVQYSYIRRYEFVIMPNHFHSIIQIMSCRDRSRPVPTENIKIKSLSSLIGAFKTTSSKKIHNLGCNHFLWQRSFYDRIIRNEYEYFAIRKYIRDNPTNWENGV